MQKLLFKIMSWFMAFLIILMNLAGGITNVFSDVETPLSSSSMTIESGETYTISSKAELDNFKALVDAGNTFEGATVKLTNDIILGTEWTAIGVGYTTKKDFSGTFDGQNFRILNPIYPYENKNTYGIGFFASLVNATVKNVRLINVSYNPKNSSYKTYTYLGAVAGYAKDSVVDNCCVEGDSNMIPAQSGGTYSTPEKIYVGGIVGYSSNSTIMNCTNEMNIQLDKGGSRVGGIVGYASGGKIEGCINKGTVQAGSGQSYNNGMGVGGIASEISGVVTIDRCVNEGTVISKWTSGTYESASGGIVGLANSSVSGQKITISNCWNKGDVYTNSAYVAGIIGRTGNSASGAYYPRYSGNICPAWLFNCLNTGKIGKENKTTASYAAGLIGGCHTYTGGVVENCFNQGYVMPPTSSYSPNSAFISYCTSGWSNYSGNLTAPYGDYGVAYIKHSYNYNQGAGTSSISVSGGGRTKARGCSADCVNAELASMLTLQQQYCDELNEYASKETTFSIAVNTDSSVQFNEAPVFTETGNARDYVPWTYDATEAENHGYPHLDITNIGYSTELRYTVKYTDGVSSEVVFSDQSNTVTSGAATPAFNTTGVTLDSSGNPARNGYIFNGWTPEVTPTVTSNITYTATWIEDKNGNGIDDSEETHYTVTYTDGTDSESIFANQSYNVVKGSSTPAFVGNSYIRDGYHFAGWSPEISSTVNGDTVYVAQWVEDKNDNGIDDSEETHYTVTYSYGVPSEGEELSQDYSIVENAETPEFDTDEVTVDITVDEHGNLVREGYKFLGWDPEIAPSVSQDVTYVAQWMADKNGNDIDDEGEEHYDVRFTDGTGNEDAFGNQTYSVVINANTPELDMSGLSPDTNGNPSRDDYFFTGWDPALDEKVTGDVTYVAQWVADRNGNGTDDTTEEHHNITYNDGTDGNEVFADQTLSVVDNSLPLPLDVSGIPHDEQNNPKRDGYVFKGWNKPVTDPVTQDIIYQAVWGEDKNGNGIDDAEENGEGGEAGGNNNGGNNQGGEAGGNNNGGNNQGGEAGGNNNGGNNQGGEAGGNNNGGNNQGGEAGGNNNGGNNQGGESGGNGNEGGGSQSGEAVNKFKYIFVVKNDWSQNSDKALELTVKRTENDEECFDHFTAIEIDDEVVDPENYTAVRGSVKLSIDSEYLKTLSTGTHKINAVFDDGNAVMTFKINEASAIDGKSISTGDTVNTGIYMLLMLISLIAVICTVAQKKQSKRMKSYRKLVI